MQKFRNQNDIFFKDIFIEIDKIEERIAIIEYQNDGESEKSVLPAP